MTSIRLLVLLLFCGTLEAQNLLENPGFDDDLSGWTLGGTVLPVWDPFDAGGSPSSGSAFITNAAPGTDTDVEVLSQCFVIGPDRFDWDVWVFIPSGQDRTGSVVLRYSFHPNTLDCTQGSNSLGGVALTTLGQWTSLGGNPVTISPEQFGSGGSFKYTIAIRKSEDGGQFTAYVDDATLFGDSFFRESFE